MFSIFVEMTYCCRATWERDDVSLEILDTAGDVSPKLNLLRLVREGLQPQRVPS